MGKGLNGTELGVGISQRKDGIYCARFVNRLGHRKYIYDNNLRRIKQLLKQAIKEDKEKSNLEYDYTLNQWYVNTFLKDLADKFRDKFRDEQRGRISQTSS